MSELLCAICGGNYGDMPCADTTERPEGCLRVERLKKLKAWLATPEAKAEMEKYQEQAQETILALEDARKLTPEMLNWRADI